jgi:hypothetical protein
VAFDMAMRVSRGGGFTKDVVYLRGLVAGANEPIASEQLGWIPVVQRRLTRRLPSLLTY